MASWKAMLSPFFHLGDGNGAIPSHDLSLFLITSSGYEDLSLKSENYGHINVTMHVRMNIINLVKLKE